MDDGTDAFEKALTISQEKVEAAAAAMFERGGDFYSETWEALHDHLKDIYREDARAAFTAAGFQVEG